MEDWKVCELLLAGEERSFSDDVQRFRVKAGGLERTSLEQNNANWKSYTYTHTHTSFWRFLSDFLKIKISLLRAVSPSRSSAGQKIFFEQWSSFDILRPPCEARHNDGAPVTSKEKCVEMHWIAELCMEAIRNPFSIFCGYSGGVTAEERMDANYVTTQFTQKLSTDEAEFDKVSQFYFTYIPRTPVSSNTNTYTYVFVRNVCTYLRRFMWSLKSDTLRRRLYGSWIKGWRILLPFLCNSLLFYCGRKINIYWKFIF